MSMAWRGWRGKKLQLLVIYRLERKKKTARGRIKTRDFIVRAMQSIESFKRVDIDAMEQTKVYRVNKKATLLFTIVEPEHIEAERTSTAIKLGEIVLRKRMAERAAIQREKKAKRDAFYAELRIRVNTPTREFHARNDAGRA